MDVYLHYTSFVQLGDPSWKAELSNKTKLSVFQEMYDPFLTCSNSYIKFRWLTWDCVQGFVHITPVPLVRSANKIRLLREITLWNRIKFYVISRRLIIEPLLYFKEKPTRCDFTKYIDMCKKTIYYYSTELHGFFQLVVAEKIQINKYTWYTKDQIAFD